MTMRDRLAHVRALWPCALLLVAGCAGMPASAPPGDVEHAWVQRTADSGWVVRAVTTGRACPAMHRDAHETQMAVRVQPAVIARRENASQAQAKDSVFAELVCEAPLPPGVGRVSVGSHELSAPRVDIRRIVLIGDTGCRMKRSEGAFQNCNDASQWPFAAVARSAAAKQPDLVIHLGDIHYRESACPEGRGGCAGSAWGYGFDAWQADFFRPAAPLLAAAPWLFVRGNHESCNRAGVGWFRLLDARAWSLASSCIDPHRDMDADFTEPYAVPLSANTQLIVFDSSFVSGGAYNDEDASFKRYTMQLAQVARLAADKPHNVFLNHHPVLGFSGSPNGAPKPGNEGLRSVMAAAHPARLFADGIDLVLNGHVHLFEALGFSSGHPAEVVVGNAGSAMEGYIDDAAARSSQPARGATVQAFATQPGFGFATLDLAGTAWRLTEWSVAGQALKVCEIEGARVACHDAR